MCNGCGTRGRGEMDRARFLRLGGAAVAGVALAGISGEDARAASQNDYPGAVWRPAYRNNYAVSDREHTYDINRIVIHVAEGGYAGTIEEFQKRDNWRSAAHYVVGRAGQVTQCVMHKNVAIHAGNSAWNRHSIGIEHEGFGDNPNTWTDAMYVASARLAAYCCRRHRIPVDVRHIVGHNRVPDTDTYCPGRYFDLDKYLTLVRRYR